jgi:hypothetical protein
MHSYCVVLRPRQALNNLYPQTKRYYLRARSAAQAIFIASEDPEWLVCGVEPASMSAAIAPGVPSENVFAQMPSLRSRNRQAFARR